MVALGGKPAAEFLEVEVLTRMREITVMRIHLA